VDEVRIPPAGDGFYAAGSRTEAELLEDLADDEVKRGRPHTPKEREAFARAFFGKEYRCDMRRLAALGVEPPEEYEA
jgi:hypothetical protein